MKKMIYNIGFVFSFLLLFWVSNLVVYAEQVDINYVSPYETMYACTGEYEVIGGTVHETIWLEFRNQKELETVDEVRVACIDGGVYGGHVVYSNVSYGFYVTGIDVKGDTFCSTSDTVGPMCLQLRNKNYSFGIPYFSIPEKGKAYVDGTSYDGKMVDISDCDNWEEIKIIGATYDSSIPAPTNLYINALSSSSVTSVWTYTGDSYQGLTYEVEIENFYASQSFTYNIMSGYTGSSINESVKFNGYINATNQIICPHTVEDYLKNPSGGLDEEILVSGISDKSSGDMHSTNTYISTPKNYSNEFVSSGIPFFTGATNSKHAIYVGSQVTVTPYRETDGILYKGNSVVCRRFINDALNTLVGSTFTEVGNDSSGNSYIVNTGNVDTYGNSTSGSVGDSGTFFSFLNQLFSLISDQKGLLGVYNNLLSTVPNYIWILIGFSIVVGIVIMIVNYSH